MVDNKKKSAPTALQRLIEEPKGHIDYAAGEAFMLYVFWEAPSATAAHKLLQALQGCARATRRDTPCVPTYFFRISSNNQDLASPAPRTAGEHPAIRAALAKIQKGIPKPAVLADLVRRGLDPHLVDLDPSTQLPPDLQAQPVTLEFTEIYLDERAFNQHAGSRDYLEAYGGVMQPGLQNGAPVTVRLGTPTASLVEKILDPILKEIALPLPKGCILWQNPPGATGGDGVHAIFLSLDIPGETAEATAASLPAALHEYCSTCVAFPHPIRAGTVRLVCILSSLPPSPVLAALAALHPARGEAHLTSGDEAAADLVRAALSAVGLTMVAVNATEGVGYVLHEKASELHCR